MIVWPPCTPTAWAVTAIHAAPERIASLCPEPQSDAISIPADTLSHSTKTVPLNFFGLFGR